MEIEDESPHSTGLKIVKYKSSVMFSKQIDLRDFNINVFKSSFLSIRFYLQYNGCDHFNFIDTQMDNPVTFHENRISRHRYYDNSANLYFIIFHYAITQRLMLVAKQLSYM